MHSGPTLLLANESTPLLSSLSLNRSACMNILHDEALLNYYCCSFTFCLLLVYSKQDYCA